MPYRDKIKAAAYDLDYQRRNKGRILSRDTRKYVAEIKAKLNKRCSKCGQVKPVQGFYMKSLCCKPCHHDRSKEWNKRNRVRRVALVRGSHLRRKFGITIEDERAMVEKQYGKCAICEMVKLLSVDHCHKTRKVRKLLCRQCNSGIGMFKDDVGLVEKALKYLKSE